MKAVKPIALYRLNECILWRVNRISIKLLFLKFPLTIVPPRTKPFHDERRFHEKEPEDWPAQRSRAPSSAGGGSTRYVCSQGVLRRAEALRGQVNTQTRGAEAEKPGAVSSEDMMLS